MHPPEDRPSHRPEPGHSTAVGRLLRLEPDEVAPVLWSALYYFSLLAGYYVLRPVRDAMGIAGGVGNLQWLFTATFLVMLAAVPAFGWAAARLPRRRLLPAVYLFFVANLLIFFLLFQAGTGRAWVARAFFVWLSVFNLFVVSVFWSFMADIFTPAQGRRLFGPIAAGGSAGAIAGPGVTAVLAEAVGPVNLLPVAAGFLGVALVCIARLNAWAAAGADAQAVGGGMWEGVREVAASRYLLGICAFLWLFTSLSTFLYFQQAHIVAAALPDAAGRTRLFAAMDLATNGLTVIAQVLLTARIVGWLGVGRALAALPAVVAVGFGALAAAPVLPMLVVFQVLRRAGNFALTKPAREMLFTVVDRRAKYKAKNFVDTVVYRGGDALSGWFFAGLTALGLGVSAIAWAAVPIAVIWLYTGLLLGRRYASMTKLAEVDSSTPDTRGGNGGAS